MNRYKKSTSDTANSYSTTQEINAQFYQQESKKLCQKIQMLQSSNRHLMGEGLGSLNVKELKQLESRLERGITRIRSKKQELILAEIEHLQKRDVQLEHENACLIAKVAETERLQQLSMMPGGNDFEAIQTYLARNLHLNLMEKMPPAPYTTRDKKILHLG